MKAARLLDGFSDMTDANVFGHEWPLSDVVEGHEECLEHAYYYSRSTLPLQPPCAQFPHASSQGVCS